MVAPERRVTVVPGVSMLRALPRPTVGRGRSPVMMAWLTRNRQNILTSLGLSVTVIVAGFGAWQSWGHITHVGHMVGEPTAPFTAVSIDGMMFVGGVMGAVDRYRGFKTRWWAIIALVMGSIMSGSANVASALERGWLASVWATVPAVSLFVCVEIMFHPSRRLIEVAQEVIAAVESAVEAISAGPVIDVLAGRGAGLPAGGLALAEGCQLAPLISGAIVGPPRPPRKRTARRANPTQARGAGTRKLASVR
jgi:hypothetical protein